MREKTKAYLRRFIIAAFFLVFLMIPLCLYTYMRLGWPPVIGNLLAARSMTSYAAQVHPDWTPEDGWASYWWRGLRPAFLRYRFMLWAPTPLLPPPC